MAGDANVACEVASWVAAVVVIDVSNLCLCGGEPCVCPADVAGLCQHGRGIVPSVPRSHNRQCGRGAIDSARQFRCILGREARAHRWKADSDNAPVQSGWYSRQSRKQAGICNVRNVQGAAGSGRVASRDDEGTPRTSSNLPFLLTRGGSGGRLALQVMGNPIRGCLAKLAAEPARKFTGGGKAE
ncbi:hypothetical protein R69919_00854 [Paraburkholderia gardini]|nr:hypothetical protein R69919_00854 [Paraburkholderia gardini]